jgi:hypothetical protein
MDGLTTKEVKASLRMMGAQYRVKIFQADYAHTIEDRMNQFLDGIGTKIDIIEFFPVGTATALAYDSGFSVGMSNPVRVEITTPGSSSDQSYCTKCGQYENDALTTSQTPQEKSVSAFAVGLLYIEYPEKQSEQAD